MVRIKTLNMWMSAIMLISVMAAGCSHGMPNNSTGAAANTVPSDIRNTRWIGQDARSNVMLDIGTNGINVSGTGTQWDGWCGYGGVPGNGNGCCTFRTNNGTVFTWQYTRQGNTLNVWNCSNPELNGQWTLLQ